MVLAWKKRNDAQNSSRQCLFRKIILLSLFKSPPLKTSKVKWILIISFGCWLGVFWASRYLISFFLSESKRWDSLQDILFLLFPVSVSQPLLIIFCCIKLQYIKSALLSNEMSYNLNLSLGVSALPWDISILPKQTKLTQLIWCINVCSFIKYALKCNSHKLHALSPLRT